jgi:hypothetical protein
MLHRVDVANVGEVSEQILSPSLCWTMKNVVAIYSKPLESIPTSPRCKHTRGESTLANEVHTAVRLLPQSRLFEAEIAIEKLSPNIYETTADLNQAGGEIFDTVVHKIINSMWNRKE